MKGIADVFYALLFYAMIAGAILGFIYLAKYGPDMIIGIWNVI